MSDIYIVKVRIIIEQEVRSYAEHPGDAIADAVAFTKTVLSADHGIDDVTVLPISVEKLDEI